ncbi:MAG TPA: 16S rRNA (adenine(1518)-N(6)/adenine(1519)-N(6))-dimethyltransferase RsmA [Chthonomonadales bacterium]|nr:16S rRNA (adenine(1518)-N(6)/adenine(1519)-N(6))-dimethyltransferase RsmA [Chthonomonadales bacterium]
MAAHGSCQFPAPFPVLSPMIDPASPSITAELLRAHGLRPRKRWGQNFLCDRNVRDRIVRAAALRPEECVLEIGAGLGALTVGLAQACAKVTAIELDRRLAPILEQTLAGCQNVRLIFGDFLRLDLAELWEEAFTPTGGHPSRGVVVANIPYYISSPIVEALLAHKARLARIVLLVQQEFAARLLARPGTSDYGSLSVFVQYHAQVEDLGRVSPSVFLPRPEVSSAIVRLTPVLPGTVVVPEEALFFRLVRTAFGQRRKTLLNTLSRSRELGRAVAEEALARVGIDAGRRGETLSLEEFAQLAWALAEKEV